MNVWEKQLFRKMDDAKAAAELRREKKFLMETLDPAAAEDHIRKHWQVLDARKKKEAEAAKAREAGRGMLGVLSQLKERSDEQKKAELAKIAAQLPEMEEEIEFSDED